ncbi:uncharacterized protein JCM15063_006157 [Sporobolomyces koalae]|uniref:uncharacterized protein n=1 Tax=Sporobolomyces koalae TaxID=500713 RepID=UPI00317BC2AD
MKASTELAISLGSIFGVIALILSLSFARFAFRKHRNGRATPVDPVYEAQVNATQTDRVTEHERKRWFGGRFGLTPIAEPGENGTKQYLSGWFALGSPSHAGWTASDTDGTFGSEANANERTTFSSWRESHFSRASRAARRSRKKQPRPSRTTAIEGDRDRELERTDEVQRVAPAKSEQ